MIKNIEVDNTKGLSRLSPIILMMMFFQTRQQAVATMASTYLSTGFIATILYFLIIFTPLSNYVREKFFNSFVLALFLAHLMITYPWSFYKTHVTDQNFSNETFVGCDTEKFKWCEKLTRSPEWIFYVGYIVSFGVFMPFINVANATLYSKLLNPDCQGTQQSLYDISNTMARIFAPILIMTIYTYYGPRRAWEFMALIVFITTSLWIIFDHRLVPLKPVERRQIYDNDLYYRDKAEL